MLTERDLHRVKTEMRRKYQNGSENMYMDVRN